MFDFQAASFWWLIFIPEAAFWRRLFAADWIIAAERLVPDIMAKLKSFARENRLKNLDVN